jgi:cyclopropane fatty-acyl-phospholipid synthase-like methyltransferase
MRQPACPVCRSAEVSAFACVRGSRYWRCNHCAATFLDPAQRPGPAAELAHYRRHRNDPADPDYRRFLARLAEPLLGKLAPGSAILDYGCGPGPALSRMLEEAGHRVSLFDPFFHPDPTPLGTRYDAVTCTEVAEHFHEPADEFDRLALLLKPGGWLALLTCWQTDDARFVHWHYRRDPTHVVFFRSSTLVHLARSRGWSIELPVKDVALMRLPL